MFLGVPQAAGFPLQSFAFYLKSKRISTAIPNAELNDPQGL